MRLFIGIMICALTISSCQKEELPDAEPIAIIDESVTLNVHAKTQTSSGGLQPLLNNTIELYLSEQDRSLSENIYYQRTTNTAGTATFTSVEIGDHIFLKSITTGGDVEKDDFTLGTALIINVEILH